MHASEAGHTRPWDLGARLGKGVSCTELHMCVCREFYLHLQNWILTTELDSYRSGRVFECAHAHFHALMRRLADVLLPYSVQERCFNLCMQASEQLLT